MDTTSLKLNHNPKKRSNHNPKFNPQSQKQSSTHNPKFQTTIPTTKFKPQFKKTKFKPQSQKQSLNLNPKSKVNERFQNWQIS